LATFEAQVKALTGITFDGSSNPTQTELSVFLQDGVKDVIHRMIEARPGELARFTTTTNSASSIAKVGAILSVAREHDDTSILRKCTVMDPGDRYDATDAESLNYRSKYNPGYYELAGSIHTIPAAGSGNNDIVVTQLFYDTGVAYGDEVPDNFPESYAYLVAIYAAVRSITANMGSLISGLSSFSVTAVPPDAVTAPSFTTPDISGIFNPATSPPTYTPPKIGGATEELTTTITNDTDADANKLDFSDWFEVAGDYIQTDEDVELASAQISKISTYLTAYQAAMQNQLNEFNDANVEYQAQLQQAQAEAGLKLQEENQEYSAKLQKYSSDLSTYQGEVSSQVSEQSEKMKRETAKYQWLQERYKSLSDEYMSAFTPIGPAARGGE